MFFGQLSGQDSLRGIEAGLATQAKSLYHLGIKPIHRTTLSYANEHRPHELFQKTFFWMLSKCQAIAPRHDFRFKNPLDSLDATVIGFCLSLYDWAKFITTKEAVKLPVKLNHSGYLSDFAVVITGKTHEQIVAPSIPLEKGGVVVFGRGYHNLKWCKSLDDRGVFFVTRLKNNANYKVTQRRRTGHLNNIYSDQTIELKEFYSKQKFPSMLRRIRSKDPDSGKIIAIITNNFTWSAKTIAQIVPYCQQIFFQEEISGIG
jgi:putative transposase